MPLPRLKGGQFCHFSQTTNYYYLIFDEEEKRNNCALHHPHFFFSLTYIICLWAGVFAVEEEVKGAGLLLNTQWDAFDSVRSNLVLVQSVPGACQHDLGFLWSSGRVSLNWLWLELANAQGLPSHCNRTPTHTQSHVHKRSNTADVDVCLHRNTIIPSMRKANIIKQICMHIPRARKHPHHPGTRADTLSDSITTVASGASVQTRGESALGEVS